MTRSTYCLSSSSCVTIIIVCLNSLFNLENNSSNADLHFVPVQLHSESPAVVVAQFHKLFLHLKKYLYIASKKLVTRALAASRPITLALNHASMFSMVHIGLVTKPNEPVLMTRDFQVSECTNMALSRPTSVDLGPLMIFE
jgi:hypothetical protein